MNRLSRQFTASSRILRFANAPVARIPSLIRSRNYASQPGKESAKTLSPKAGPNSFLVNNFDDLVEILESPAGQTTLRRMSREASQQLKEILPMIIENDSEADDIEMLHAAASLLSMSGLPVTVTVPIPQASVTELNVSDPTQPEVKNAEDELDPEPETYPRPYPNLMSADPLMDSREVLDLGPTPTNPFHNRVIVRNHRSIFHESMALDGFDFDDPKWKPAKSDLADEEMDINESSGLEQHYPVDELLKFDLVTRNTTQQTGKGKINHFQVFTVVGDGEGMVGLGMGTDTEPATALTKAQVAAVKNMDYVDRFENRTIWTDLSGKFRSTQILMRPRPMGFGLRCQPILHQILKAAGIKDISAKVWGSRNPIMIMQGALRMLQGGHNPLGFGNGIGGRGKNLTKGIGMRSKLHVERERGRKLADFRK